MKLQSRIFAEPNPFNPEWKIPFAVARPVGFDMTVEGQPPRLEPTPDGGAVVRAYTDLKRHNLCDDRDQFFCNERLIRNGIAPSSFLTRRLWDIGSSAAFGHRGDLSTITEAIEHHAGEARPSLMNFLSLPAYGRAAIVEFLKTLQVRARNPARRTRDRPKNDVVIKELTSRRYDEQPADSPLRWRLPLGSASLLQGKKQLTCPVHKGTARVQQRNAEGFRPPVFRAQIRSFWGFLNWNARCKESRRWRTT